MPFSVLLGFNDNPEVTFWVHSVDMAILCSVTETYFRWLCFRFMMATETWIFMDFSCLGQRRITALRGPICLNILHIQHKVQSVIRHATVAPKGHTASPLY